MGELNYHSVVMSVKKEEFPLSESLHSIKTRPAIQWFFIFLKSGTICCSLEFVVPLALVAFLSFLLRLFVGLGCQ